MADVCSSFGCRTLNGLLEITDPVVSGIYDGLMGSWPGMLITGLYVLLVGYAVIMGRAGDKAKEWAVSACLLTVISAFSANYGRFEDWIGSPMLALAQNGGALAASGGESGGAGGVSALLDTAENNLGMIMATIDELEVPGNLITQAWLYIKVGAVVVLMTILACAMYLAQVALLCIALFSLKIMQMVAGPCMFFLAFKETRFIPGAWLRSSLNYSMWVIFLCGVSGIGNKFIAKVANALRSWDLENQGVFTAEVGTCMLLTGLSIYMLLKAADWAAAITGGTASQTGIVGGMIGAAGYGLGSAIGGAARGLAPAMKEAATGAGYLAGRGAGNLAARAFSALRGIGGSR